MQSSRSFDFSVCNPHFYKLEEFNHLFNFAVSGFSPSFFFYQGLIIINVSFVIYVTTKRHKIPNSSSLSFAKSAF